MLKRRWVRVELMVGMTIVICGCCGSSSQHHAKMHMAKPSPATHDEPFVYTDAETHMAKPSPATHDEPFVYTDAEVHMAKPSPATHDEPFVYTDAEMHMAKPSPATHDEPFVYTDAEVHMAKPSPATHDEPFVYTDAETHMAKPSPATHDEPFVYTDAEMHMAKPSPATYDDPFVYMKDNAMRHQASISDLHFVPHTTELNGLGVAYLDRLAKLHAPYGGTVRYATNSTDETFVATRLAHLADYLEAAGADMNRITVVAAMPGGRGMRADRALTILAGNTEDENLAKRMQVSQIDQ